MGQPIWQDRNTDLGTIAENIFFEYELAAIDTDGQVIAYSLVAGILPPGIQVTGTNISGIPVKITGVPAEVDIDTSSKFSIRAQTTTGDVSDVTFDLSVSGQKIPHIITPGGKLDEYYYGNYVDVQIEAIDEDVNNELTWDVKVNTLPDGLELTVDPDDDRIAYIRGYPTPVSALPAGTGVGYDNQTFDQDLGAFGFDYRLATIDKNYEFTIAVTDGIGYDSRKFSIFLRSKFNLTCDNDEIRADSLLPTVDITTELSPIVTNEILDFGSILHDNYFAAKITGRDFEGDAIEFREQFKPTSFPPSLTLDPITGWMHGTLDSVVLAEQDYSFQIVAYKVNNPDIISLPVTFKMQVVGDLSNRVTWVSPDEMTIDNGAISELAVEAEVNFDTVLEYTLTIGSLPDGLILSPDGLIIGRPTFLHFTLDEENTTIDGGNTDFDGFGGSFDNTYTFTINVTDTTVGLVNANKEFTILVRPVNSGPYENLYLVGKYSIEDRLYHSQLIENELVAPPENIYRLVDPNFGISSNLRFLLADGLQPQSATVYAEAMEENHYTRSFSFGELTIAKSITDNNTVYEVIYTEMTDHLMNKAGESIEQELITKNISVQDLANHNAVPKFDSNNNIVIHPASLVNMRNRIFDVVGRVSKNTLPGWMTSIQDDGRTLGFINAVPILYCKPGTAEKILFDIKNSGFNINNIDFTVDRYVWDNNLTEFDVNVTNTDVDENDQILKFPFANVFR